MSVVASRNVFSQPRPAGVNQDMRSDCKAPISTHAYTEHGTARGVDAGCAWCGVCSVRVLCGGGGVCVVLWGGRGRNGQNQVNSALQAVHPGLQNVEEGGEVHNVVGIAQVEPVLLPQVLQRRRPCRQHCRAEQALRHTPTKTHTRRPRDRRPRAAAQCRTAVVRPTGKGDAQRRA